MSRRAAAAHILEILDRNIPSATTELAHADPYELLVAVILSAQCTDARVNEVTPGLFRVFPDITSLADGEPSEVFSIIRSISFPNNKSKHLVKMARRVRDVYGGHIPTGLDALQTLAGVGRKTAQVVAGVAFGLDAMPVDTHVFRVAHRLDLVTRDAGTPDAVERQLRRVVPKGRLSDAHHLMILHGRYTCTARSPKCTDCPLSPICAYRAALDRLPPPVSGLERSKGKYWCRSRRHYLDDPVQKLDRTGVEQLACSRCGSMTLFDSRNGRSVRRIRDPRPGDLRHGSPDHRT